MSASVIGKRYAKALFELASEANSLERVARDLTDFAKSWADNRELRGAFENPAFGAEVRRNILRDLAQQTSMHEHVRNLALLLSDRRRLRHVGEIAESFQAMTEAGSGRVRAEVTSASELPDAYYTELARALSAVVGREVVVTRRVDPTLLGGVVTRIGDQIFDGSVSHRLGELKEELLR